MSTSLFSRELAEDRGGGVWAYVSASRLNTWLACPLKFKLKYIDGIREPPSPSLFLGKVVHKALEVHYRHRQLGQAIEPAELADRITDSWDQAVVEEEMRFESVADEQLCRSQALGLVDAYLRHVPSNEARPLAVEAAVEAPLVDPESGEQLGIPLVGVIDLVLAQEIGALIADFKTAARSSEPLEISHEVQLSCYAYLFRATSGQSEGGLEIRNLIKTKSPQIQFHAYEPRSDRHFRRLFAVIRAYLDDLDRGRFVYRPGLGCGMCDFVHTHCQKWAG